MTRDPVSGIRVLDSTIDYADGAEDRLLEILGRADDLSSLSDELAAQIDDWPTRYHLARERSNLLRPLSIDRRTRILEIGAGTGAISRFLGETGASVVALEGSLPRARAAAARCRDLDNVEVVCGALDAFEDPDGFDLVCLIGVLEYAGMGALGSDPASFLQSASAHLKPNGTLAVAIENQIGLKYLLGYDEDHLGRPWAGLEGYRDGSGIRTFARQQLKALLEGCGLGFQKWLYPFPDYKLSTVVLSDAAYDEADVVEFIDQVIRYPVGGSDTAPMLLCDERRVHRVMLEAGLGREVANSFLVLASAESENLTGSPDPHSIAWLYGSQRRRRWIRHQVVENTSSGRRIRAHGPDDLSAERTEGWLRQDPCKNDPFIIGATLWGKATDACRRRDIDALRQSLDLWRQTIDHERTVAPEHGNPSPFLLEDTRDVLPPDYLDICLSNFVVSDTGVDYVDREWIAEPAVDADLVSVRGLWLLAQGLVRSGGIHPWDPSLTVAELTVELGDLANLPARDHLDRLDEIEAELLHLVTGRDQGVILTDLQWLRSFRATDTEAIRSLPISRLREQLDAIRAELANLGVERSERARLEDEVASERSIGARQADELTAAHERLTEVGAKLEEVAAALKLADSEMASLGERANKVDALEQLLTEGAAEAAALVRQVAALEAERDALKAWADAFEKRLSVRLLRRLQGLVGRRH